MNRNKLDSKIKTAVSKEDVPGVSQNAVAFSSNVNFASENFERLKSSPSRPFANLLTIHHFQT
jgi:hypothetical protein